MGESKTSRLLNLPNWLTLGRIASIPLILLLLLFGQGGPVTSIMAAILFLAAVLTDLLDGYLARRYKLETNLGRFLDPLADKLLNAGALIMLIPLNRVAAWMVFLILGRELAITGLRGIAATEGIVISANAMGKQKTLTQNIAIFCLIWYYPMFGRNTYMVGVVLLWLALVITYWSGYRYFREFYRVLKTDSEQKGLDSET